MEGADKKTGAPKSVYEESLSKKDSKRSPRVNPNKDTTRDDLKSNKKSTEDMEGEGDDSAASIDTSNEPEIRNDAAASSDPQTTTTPRRKDTPSRRRNRDSLSSVSSRTRASESSPTRRSTRSSGSKVLVEGLGEPPLSSSSKSSGGSKPLRDASGRFISKTKLSGDGNDHVSNEDPPKQQLAAHESPQRIKETEISPAEKERRSESPKDEPPNAAPGSDSVKPEVATAATTAKSTMKAALVTSQPSSNSDNVAADNVPHQQQRGGSDAASKEPEQPTIKQHTGPEKPATAAATTAKEKQPEKVSAPQRITKSDTEKAAQPHQQQQQPPSKEKAPPDSSVTSRPSGAPALSSALTTNPPEPKKPAVTSSSSSSAKAAAASAPKPPPAAASAPVAAAPPALSEPSAAAPAAPGPDLGMYGPANVTRGLLHAADEAAIYAARAPLTDMYGQYICQDTDTSLNDARARLKKAIAQTRDLRHLFTARVYEKYRVCMKPPEETEEIIARIMKDPAGEQQRIKEEMAQIREEKEVEKQEASKLNSEMQQSGSGDRAALLSNVDNAEQVMYLTAGLNLVILPEEDADPKLVEGYAERGPVNQTNGQRVKNISQAAATAGEVILDRTRKAAAMRVERQRRRQLQLLRGEIVADGEAESNYSRLQVLKAASSTTGSGKATSRTAKVATAAAPTTALKQPPVEALRKAPSAASKSGRSRPQSALSTNALLNLNPTADELKIDTKPNASTTALIARGVGPASNKSMHQRLRHPHPESLGGRRRASATPSKQAGAMNPPEPFLQANLANTLPPLPSTKDRLDRKPLPVQTLEDASSERARKSIEHVMRSFSSDNPKEQLLRPVSKINVLNNLRKMKTGGHTTASKPPPSNSDAATMPPTDAAIASNPPTRTLNPSLTVSVLHALGIIGRPPATARTKPYSLPKADPENKAVWSEKLIALRGTIVADVPKLNEIISREEKHFPDESRKRPAQSSATANEPAAKVSRTDQPEATSQPEQKVVPVPKVRGGSEGLASSKDDDPRTGSRATADPERKNEKSDETGSAANNPSAAEEPKKRKRADSSPGRPPASSTTGAKRRPSDHTAAPFAAPHTAPGGFLGRPQLGATMNAMHIANQLHHMHHPAAGDLADYLGSLQQQQGFDFSSLMAGAAQGQQNNIGLAGHHTLPDRAAAATAMLIREQQAAALLGGFPPSVYPPVAPHPAAFPNFFGGQAGHFGQTPQHTMPGLGASQKHQEQLQMRTAGMTGPTKAAATADAHNSSNRQPESSSNADDSSKKMPAVRTSSSQGTQRPMKFNAPSAPSSLAPERANQIKSGKFHDAVAQLGEAGSAEALKFLVAVGSAVPIPKGLVLGPLKERLNTPGFKNTGNNGAPPFTRDVVAAAILVWLWSAHEQAFQKAFEKHGRIDVDPDCKWLVQAAVDFAVSELSLEIAESMARDEGAFAEAAATRKAAPQGDSSAAQKALEKLDVCTASIVSRALTVEMQVDIDMNTVVPKYQQYVEFLDESRMGALRAKSQERALLATLVARKAMMTESLAHAYVSAMVRAGEALGHGKLFEIAQDEETMASTMIPYDILTDDNGHWEDPCKPENGFTKDLTGDDLVRRAHARAIIQKSLRKLQDRNHIRGGTSNYGPFVDSAQNDDRKPVPAPSPRPGPKRRNSSLAEPSITPGTGSAEAKSWRVYQPNHSCSPLDWDPDILDHGPYGVHAVSTDRMRSMSLSLGRGATDLMGKTKRSTSMSLSHLAPRAQPESDFTFLQSTREIDWEDVASTFQSVELPKKSSRNVSSFDHHHSTPVFIDGTIFAPYCRKIERELSTDEDESETEEDLSEETTLARHQVVLDEMKQKLNAYLEARKKQQEARKNRCK